MFELVVDYDKLSCQLYHTYIYIYFFFGSFLDLNRSVHGFHVHLYFTYLFFKKNYILQEEATYLCSADRAISMCQCSKVRVQHGSFPPHIVNPLTPKIL